MSEANTPHPPKNKLFGPISGPYWAQLRPLDARKGCFIWVPLDSRFKVYKEKLCLMQIPTYSHQKFASSSYQFRMILGLYQALLWPPEVIKWCSRGTSGPKTKVHNGYWLFSQKKNTQIHLKKHPRRCKYQFWLILGLFWALLRLPEVVKRFFRGTSGPTTQGP